MKKLLVLVAVAALALVAPASSAGAAEVGPCTTYQSNGFAAIVCKETVGILNVAVTPSVSYPPQSASAVVGGGVCYQLSTPWCAHYLLGTYGVDFCIGNPYNPGNYRCYL